MATLHKKNQGFTLFEVIIVIAIIILIISFGTIVDLNVFKQDTFQVELFTAVSALERARSRAMANMFESAHGVCYIEPNYVIFRENKGHCVDGESTNELIPANANIATASDFSSDFPTFVFDQLTGTTSGATINITDGIKSADIEINDEGTINW